VAEREFNVQVMETAAQWSSGLHSRLTLSGDGLSLFVNPVFDSWLVVEDWSGGAGDIVVDECGQTYWAALEPPRKHRGQRVWNLLRHNPTTREVERLLSFAGCGRIEPKKLWLSPDYLWLFDESESETSAEVKAGEGRRGRVLAMSRDNYQIIYEVIIDKLFDVDLDKKGFLYTLVKDDSGQRQICRYSIPPLRADQKICRTPDTWKQPKAIPPDPECFTLKQWQEPEALAVGRKGILYVLDTALGRFIRYDPDTKEETLLGKLQEKLPKDFKWSAMQIDDRGVIFLALASVPKKPETPEVPEQPASLHMFDEDGSYLGKVELPSSVKSISGIGFDRNGGVYLATDQGLARFTLAKNPVGQEGLFYSKTLDNGHAESLWHRIALQGSIPGKTSVEVYYYASDDRKLKEAYEREFSGIGSVEEKTAKIEDLLKNRWTGPETFTGSEAQESATSKLAVPGEATATPDLILNPNKGQFLWLKLKLITFDEKSRPSIRAARIYYPRLSYLRYLPPAYREEPVSAAFLERFLSIFETVFEDLDQRIDQLFRYFDPGLVPKEFLPWLASWINLSLDDDLPEQRIRQLIRRAPHLYARKGTPGALVEFLEIYTGRSVFLTEHARSLKPQVLGGPDFRLGHGILLLGSGPKGMRVGDTTVVGYAAIRDRVSDADEPFLPLARRFTISIDLEGEEFQKQIGTLRRIVNEQKPSHTVCTIQSSAGRKTVGTATLGVNATVVDTQPYRVGVTPLGTGSAIAKGPRALRLERGAGVGTGGRLR
jgi:phage tail-like protein